jgi:putative ABC transport system permease protein
MLALLRLISIRHIFGSPLRSSITVLGIAVGVATMVGIAAINTSVMDAFRSTIDTIAGKADLTVAGTPIGFDDSLLEKIQKLDGVTHAAGSVTAIAPVKGSPGESLYVMGVDLLDDGFFRTYEGVDRDVGQMADDLEFLNSTDRMLVSERFAREHNLKTGDSFTLLTTTGAADFVIHGLLKETGPIKAFGGSVGVMYLGSAQAAFHRGRNIDRIDVAVDPKQGIDVMKPRIEAMAGMGMKIDRPERRGQSVEKMIRSFQLGLNLGSGVALLVGIFLVYNTVAIGVVQRRREIGTLRALGATRFRIRALFTMEAAVLGLFGTLVGIPLGTIVARLAISWVAGTISSIYIQVNAKDVFVGPQEMMMGAALGILGSVFAALRPAIVASRVQPVEALRRDIAAGADMATLKSWPTMLAVVFASLVYPATLIPPPAENFPLGGYLAMFLIMMVTTLLSPLALRGLQRVYQWPSEKALGIPGRLAADNFARAPVRTAVPVSALAIGVGMTICIAGFVGSFQKSSEKWIDQSIPADLFVTSSAKVGGVQNTPMNADLRDPIEAMAGVNKVDMVRIYPTDVLGLRIYIVSLDPEIYHLRGNPEIIDGKLPTPAERAEGYVTVSENLARRRDLKRGSEFTMETPTGAHTYKVAAVITDYSSDQGTVFMDRRYFTRDFNDHLVDTFQVYMKDATKIEDVRREINERYGTKHDLYVLSNVELRKEAYDLVSNAFAVTYAMEGVAVLLALLGVINTLLAAVLDRTREIGLLRAIGAARMHVIKLFIGEAALIGLTGGAIGTLLGYALGFTLTKVVGVQSTGWNFPFIFPTELALQMLAASTVCAILAGIYPARRAASLDVVEALAYE